jgi:hypothetical protein
VRFRTNTINHSLSLRDKYHSIILRRCDQLARSRPIARNDGIKKAILSILLSLRALIDAAGIDGVLKHPRLIGALGRRLKSL